MNAFRYLSDEAIAEIYHSAVCLGLDKVAPALLGSLDPLFVANLPFAGLTSGANLLSVLHHLNRIKQLSTGVIPLQSWLKFAIVLAPQVREAEVLRSAHDEIQRRYLAAQQASGSFSGVGEKRIEMAGAEHHRFFGKVSVISSPHESHRFPTKAFGEDALSTPIHETGATYLSSSIMATPSWMAALDMWLARFPCDIDARYHAANTTLQRLAELVDVGGILTALEWEMLVGSTHVYVCIRDADQESMGNDSEEELSPSGPSVSTLLSVARCALQYADSSYKRVRSRGKPSVRVDVLAGLLRVAKVLLLDRVGVEPALVEKLDDAFPLEAWVAAYTMALRIHGPVVKHFLCAGSTAAAARLEAWLWLKFADCMTEVRGILASAGIAVSMAHPQISVSRDFADVPAAVLERLRESSDLAAGNLPNFEHLGEDETVPPLDLVLPLPIGALAENLVVPVPAGDEFGSELCLIPEEDEDVSTSTRSVTFFPQGRWFVVDFKLLSPGTRYRWGVWRDEGLGRVLIAEGAIRTLSAEEAALWQVFASEPPELKRAAAAAFGLWHNLLFEIWPKILLEPSLPDLLILLGIFIDAQHWLRLHAPNSTQIDAVRDVGGWIYNRIDSMFIRQPICKNGERIPQ